MLLSLESYMTLAQFAGADAARRHTAGTVPGGWQKVAIVQPLRHELVFSGTRDADHVGYTLEDFVQRINGFIRQRVEHLGVLRVAKSLTKLIKRKKSK